MGLPIALRGRRRPRLFFGWYIVGASVLLNFYLSVFFFQGFQMFFLPILREFGWSRAMTSGAFSLRQLESGILAPAIGFLVDRWGPRFVILAGVVVAGAGLVMLSAINSVWTFYAAFLLASLGTSGASHGVSWAVAVANWFRRRRGMALGIAMLGPVVAGPFIFLVAVAEEALGWRTALLIIGIGTWVVGLPLGLVARTSPERYGYLPDGDAPVSGDSAGDQVALEREWEGMTVAQAVRERDFWVLSLVFGGQFVGISGLMVHLVPLLEDGGFSSTGAAAVLGSVFLLSGIGRLGAGGLADMLDPRLLLSGLLVTQAFSLVVLDHVGASIGWQVPVFALLFGASFGGTIPLRPYLLRRLFGARAFGAIQGLAQGVGVGAGVVGPVFYGWVFDVRSSYTVALYASIAVILATVPLVFLLRMPARSR